MRKSVFSWIAQVLWLPKHGSGVPTAGQKSNAHETKLLLFCRTKLLCMMGSVFVGKLRNLLDILSSRWV